MLRKIWYVAAKDLLLVAKDRPALIMLLAVPLVLMGILGSAFSSFTSSDAAITATLPIIDQDHSTQSAAFITALRHVPSLSVKLVSDKAGEEKAVRNGDEVGLLEIPGGFGNSLRSPQAHAQIAYYAVTNNTSASSVFASNVVKAVAQQFSFQSVTTSAIVRAQLQATGKPDPGTASRLAAQAGTTLQESPPVAIKPINATGRSYNMQDQTVPGYALMFALFGIAAGAGSILEEKEGGTFKRLLIAPLPPLALIGGKLLAQFIQSMLQITLLFVLGAVLFKIDLGSSILGLALLIVGTSFAATGLGLLLVSVIKNQRQLRPATTLVVLSFSAIGGSWWPQSIEPQWMQSIAKVTVNGWAMRGFNDLMIFDKGLMDILPSIAALFAYGAICFIIAQRTFRFREA